METIKEGARMKVYAKIEYTKIKIFEWENKEPLMGLTQEMIDGVVAFHNKELSQWEWIYLMIQE